jgi:ATP-binding cassette subfamily B protein
VGGLTALRDGAASLGFGAASVWRYARTPAALLLALSMVAGAAEPLFVWALGGLLEALSGVAAAAAAPADPWPRALPWLGALLLAFALGGATAAASTYLSDLTREHLQTGMQRQLFEHATRVPLATLEQPEYYQRLETGSHAVHGDVAYNVRIAANFVEGVIAAAGLLGLYAAAHPLLGVVLLATTTVRTLLRAGFHRRYMRVTYEASPLRREMAYWAGLLASRTAAPELRLFGLADALLARWRRAFERHLADVTAVRRGMERSSRVEDAIQEAVSWLTVLALLWLGLEGRIGVGQLAALLYGLRRVRDLTWTFSSTGTGLVRVAGELGHLRAFYALPVEQPLSDARPVPRPLREGVRFEGVNFTYPGASRPALERIDLTLRPQETVALVGENGAGKTTLVKLLLGLYRPTSGRITVDGVDLRQLDPGEWRREATAVFQDFGRYRTTVGENVAYADVSVLAAGAPAGAPRPHPRVVAAAERAGAAGFVARLPRGYATPLGTEFEGGVELSAGQWQRLALARAYLRDAQIVVLDEPTAALDPRAEVEVYRQFSAAAGGRCAVLISHRLGSARLADRIVVLKDGRVVEEGDHPTLLSLGGEYARLYGLQAAWYADEPAAAERREAAGA